MQTYKAAKGRGYRAGMVGATHHCPGDITTVIEAIAHFEGWTDGIRQRMDNRQRFSATDMYREAV